MAETKKCMIIGAAPVESGAVFTDFNIKDYFIICADGGYDTALKYNIVPDYIVGDFDSSKAKPDLDADNIHILPVEKDVTDTMYAAMFGLKLGYREFIIIGGSGGDRIDHTIANYNVMLYIANKGGYCVLVDSKSQTFLLRNSRLTLTDMIGDIVSVFPFGSLSCNLTYKGLKYPLKRKDLKVGDTLMGVSNQIVEDNAEIMVHNGCALVMVVKE